MENRTVRTAILSMTPGSGKTAFMEQLMKRAEVTHIVNYQEEVVQEAIADKDIVILLLNEESKEEIEECKKVAQLAKELNKFTITFVSDETAKEVQVELENEVEALVTVPRTMKESADDLILAIQGFFQTVIEAGMIDVDLEDFKLVLNAQNTVHLHTHKGNLEKVISEFGSQQSTNTKLANAKSVICHLSMGEEGDYKFLEAVSEQLHNHTSENAHIIQGVRIEEALKGNDVIVTVIVA